MHSTEELAAGMFIHYDCRTTVPPKSKFALVVAVEAHCALVFLINTELAEFIKSRSDLLNQQLSLSSRDHAFLQHDSWLDCSNAHVILDENLSSIEEKGTASPALCNQVAQIAEKSRTLNRRCKAAIATAFSQPAR